MEKILFVLLFLSAIYLAAEETRKVRPIFAIDGDSIIVTPNSEIIRLWGVDAPELDQPWGITARSAMIDMVHKRRISVEQKGTSYGRTVAIIMRGGKDIALELLKMGLAWYEPSYAPDRKDYAEAEYEAKKSKRGLWSEENPVRPSDHRKSRILTEEKEE